MIECTPTSETNLRSRNTEYNRRKGTAAWKLWLDYADDPQVKEALDNDEDLPVEVAEKWVDITTKVFPEYEALLSTELPRSC